MLTGESFAGKYLSFTAMSILREEPAWNLKNLVLSNPLVDVETERMNQH